MAGVETPNAARGKLVRKALQLNARNARGRGLPAIVLMTDDRLNADWRAAVRALPSGSAFVVRHRDARMREMLARHVRTICAARRVRLLIADDPHLAMRLRADGVHLPERRMVLASGLKARHPKWLVTTAAHGAAAASAAGRYCADAVFIAPAFATASHPGGAALGVVRLAAIANAARIFTYALGGIDEGTVARLQTTAVCGVALISGWIDAAHTGVRNAETTLKR